MTCYLSIFNLLKYRYFLCASFRGKGTAGMQRASGRRINRTGNRALQPNLSFGIAMSFARNCFQKCLGVWMHRAIENLSGITNLDNVTEIHDCCSVRDIIDHRQIVGNEHHGQSHFLFQLCQQVQNLRLDRNVQSRGRFVGNDQLRCETQCTGDANSLPLTARELVRKTIELILCQANFSD